MADLQVPPGNRLEKLTGDRAGQYSIRVNQQWRICFYWSDAGPEDQARYDLEIEKDRLGGALDGIRPPSAAS